MMDPLEYLKNLYARSRLNVKLDHTPVVYGLNEFFFIKTVINKSLQCH